MALLECLHRHSKPAEFNLTLSAEATRFREEEAEEEREEVEVAEEDEEEGLKETKVAVEKRKLESEERERERKTGWIKASLVRTQPPCRKIKNGKILHACTSRRKPTPKKELSKSPPRALQQQ